MTGFRIFFFDWTVSFALSDLLLRNDAMCDGGGKGGTAFFLSLSSKLAVADPLLSSLSLRRRF